MDTPGFYPRDLRPGTTFTYNGTQGQEFWTVIRAVVRPDNGKFDITYLIVEPFQTKFKTFQADPSHVFWTRVTTWKRPE